MDKKDDLTEKDIKQNFQMAHTLKTVLRSGWVKWGLDRKIRRESIAEHVF